MLHIYIGSFFGNIHWPILLRMSVPFSDEADSTQSPANGTENNTLQNEGRSYLFVQETHWYSLISHCPRSSDRAIQIVACLSLFAIKYSFVWKITVLIRWMLRIFTDCKSWLLLSSWLTALYASYNNYYVCWIASKKDLNEIRFN